MKKHLLKSLLALALVLVCGNVWGETKTYTFTPDNATTGNAATAYVTSAYSFTYNDIGWSFNQWNPSTLQVKTNQSSADSEFNFKNTSAFPGKITSVVITFSALTVSDASKLCFVGGTSAISSLSGGTVGTWNSTAKTLTWTPASTDNFTYFAFYQNGKAASGTNYLASSNAIVVTYEANTQTKTLTSIAISGTPDKTEYKEGDTFDPAGLVVTGNYNDNSTKEITDGITWTVDPETLTTTTTSVSVTATVDGKSDTKAYSVTVNPKPEYTIIFKVPGEDVQSSVKEGSAIADVPIAEGNQEWSFVGWAIVEVSETTKIPTLVDFDKYVVSANAIFYPVFSKSTPETSKTATSSNLNASTTKVQTLEAGKSITYKVSATNDYSNPLRVYKNSKLTISGATITQIVLEGADKNYAISNFNVEDGNWTWNSSETSGTWTGRSESVTFTASTAQARVNTITVTYIVPGITYYASTIPVTVTLTGAPSNGLYYATFIGSTNMKVDDNSVIATCFVEDGMAKTNELEGNIIPANSPVIVYTMNEDGKITLTQTTEDASAEDAEYIKDEDFNMLFGYTEDTHVDAADNTCYYALNVVDGQAGFFVPRTTDDTTNPSASNGFTAKAGKAYLKVVDATPSNGYRFGGTTLIEDIKIDNDAVYYNLLGQKVENPTNGLYIHNGKKVYVK